MWTRKRMPSYRLWGSTDDGAIEFESLTNETLSGALDVIRKNFFTRESICLGVDLMSEPGAADELIELCMEAAKDGVSVVAIDVATGAVVGVFFNKIQVADNSSEKSFFERFSEKCKHESSKALINFMVDVDSRVNLFKHYNVTCILELMFLATSLEYSKRRIGELLVLASLEIANELKRGKPVKTPVMINDNDKIQNYEAVPSLVSIIVTSCYSLKIIKKLGFEMLVEVSHDQYEFKGKKYSERIGEEHKTSSLAAKRVVL